MKHQIACIVAHDQGFGIGKDNQIPWRLSKDMAHFKRITTQCDSDSTQNVVLMGRKTWDSLPDRFKPLPDRINMVMSRGELDLPEGVIGVTSFEEAFEYYDRLVTQGKAGTFFCIGGGQLYEQCLQMNACQTLYITRVHHTYECDAFFSNYENLFTQVSSSEIFKDQSVPYSFHMFERI